MNIAASQRIVKLKTDDFFESLRSLRKTLRSLRLNKINLVNPVNPVDFRNFCRKSPCFLSKTLYNAFLGLFLAFYI